MALWCGVCLLISWYSVFLLKQTNLSSCFAFLGYTNVLYIVMALLPVELNKVKTKLIKLSLVAPA